MKKKILSMVMAVSLIFASMVTPVSAMTQYTDSYKYIGANADDDLDVVGNAPDVVNGANIKSKFQTMTNVIIQKDAATQNKYYEMQLTSSNGGGQMFKYIDQGQLADKGYIQYRVRTHSNKGRQRLALKFHTVGQTFGSTNGKYGTLSVVAISKGKITGSGEGASTVTINPERWYTITVAYDRSTGDYSVYADDICVKRANYIDEILKNKPNSKATAETVTFGQFLLYYDNSGNKVSGTNTAVCDLDDIYTYDFLNQAPELGYQLADKYSPEYTKIVFPEFMDPSTLTKENITITDGTNTLGSDDYELYYDTEGMPTRLWIMYKNPLAAETEYTVRTSGIKDVFGAAAANLEASFKTAAATEEGNVYWKNLNGVVISAAVILYNDGVKDSVIETSVTGKGTITYRLGAGAAGTIDIVFGDNTITTKTSVGNTVTLSDTYDAASTTATKIKLRVDADRNKLDVYINDTLTVAGLKVTDVDWAHSSGSAQLRITPTEAGSINLGVLTLKRPAMAELAFTNAVTDSRTQGTTFSISGDVAAHTVNKSSVYTNPYASIKSIDSANGNYAITYNSDLKMNTEYTLTLSGKITNSIGVPAKNLGAYAFTTMRETADITEIVYYSGISSTETLVPGTVEVEAYVEPATSAGKSEMLIFALYNKATGALQDIGVGEIALENAEPDYFYASVNVPNEGEYIGKVFAVRDLSGMEPLNIAAENTTIE